MTTPSRWKARELAELLRARADEQWAREIGIPAGVFDPRQPLGIIDKMTKVEPMPGPGPALTALDIDEMRRLAFSQPIHHEIPMRSLREFIYKGDYLGDGDTMPEDKRPPQRKVKHKYEPAPMPTNAEIDAVMAQIRNARRKP